MQKGSSIFQQSFSNTTNKHHLKKLTTTEDKECPKPENTVPTQSVRIMQRIRRSQ